MLASAIARDQAIAVGELVLVSVLECGRLRCRPPKGEVEAEAPVVLGHLLLRRLFLWCRVRQTRCMALATVACLLRRARRRR